MINGYDLIDARLNGSDKDGDLVLVTNNKVMRKGVVRNLPVVMDTEDKITAPDDEFNIENITKSIILSMDNRIGEYSNVATGYHNKTPKTQEIKDKYLGYIDLVSILNGKEIDYSKCGIRFNLPKYIAKYAKPLPYFMKYAGVYYAGLHKFSKSRSNLNLLCWDLEKHFRQIKFKRKFKDFDYSIMIDASISWDSDKFDCLEKLYIDFSSNMRELQKQNSMTATHENYQNFFGDLNKEEIVNTKINWNYYYEQYIDKAKEICPDDKELANYVVEICYGKYPKKSKKFAWVVAKEGIISNIPYTKSRMPLENKKGRYSYLGKRYDLIEVDIKEDI
jgi:hypothetical protein